MSFTDKIMFWKQNNDDFGSDMGSDPMVGPSDMPGGQMPGNQMADPLAGPGPLGSDPIGAQAPPLSADNPPFMPSGQPDPGMQNDADRMIQQDMSGGDAALEASPQMNAGVGLDANDPMAMGNMSGQTSMPGMEPGANPSMGMSPNPNVPSNYIEKPDAEPAGLEANPNRIMLGDPSHRVVDEQGAPKTEEQPQQQGQSGYLVNDHQSALLFSRLDAITSKIENIGLRLDKIEKHLQMSNDHKQSLW